MVPILGNIERMTLRDYLKANPGAKATLAYALSVSEHAIHKWAYGQREPSLADASEIVRLTKGKVTIADMAATSEAAKASKAA